MAGPGDVFDRSMSINAKFLPRLQAAVEPVSYTHLTLPTSR